jgi:hypothetical protein
LVSLGKQGYPYCLWPSTMEKEKPEDRRRSPNMFANVCTTCGKRELVFTDQIRSLRPTGHGFDVRYICTCGATQMWHVEHADAPRAVAAA